MGFIKYLLLAMAYFILLLQASIALAFETVSFHSASNNKNVELSVIDEEISIIVYNQISTAEKNEYFEKEISNAQNTNRMNYQDGETLRYFKNKGLI